MGNLENCVLLDGNDNTLFQENIISYTIEQVGDSAGGSAGWVTDDSFEQQTFGLDPNGETLELDPGVYKFKIAPGLAGWKVSVQNFSISGVQGSDVTGTAIPPNTFGLEDRAGFFSAAFVWENGAMGNNDVEISMHEAISRVYMHNISIEAGPEYNIPGGIPLLNNMVEVTIELDPNYVLTSDTTISLDVDGDAYNFDVDAGGIQTEPYNTNFRFHIIPYIFGNGSYSIAYNDDGSVSGGSANLDDSLYEVSPQNDNVVGSGMLQYIPTYANCCPMVAVNNSESGSQNIISDYINPEQWLWANTDSEVYFYENCGNYGEFVRAQYGGEVNSVSGSFAELEGESWFSAYSTGGQFFGAGAPVWEADFQLSAQFVEGTDQDGTLSMSGDPGSPNLNINPMNEICRAIQYHNYTPSTNYTNNMYGNTIGDSNLPDSCKFVFRIRSDAFSSEEFQVIDSGSCQAAFAWVSYTTTEGLNIVHDFVVDDDCPFTLSSTTFTDGDGTCTASSCGTTAELFFNSNFSFNGTSAGNGYPPAPGTIMKVFVFFVLPAVGGM